MQLPKAHPQEDFVTHNLEISTSFPLLNSIIIPRPIAFITTQGINGVINAAPFSYFNVVCPNPAIISVAIGRRNQELKDTARNIFSTKEFVINICSVDLAQAVTASSKDYPPEVSEIEMHALSLIPSKNILVPRVANTFIQMECVFKQSLLIEDNLADLILGNVVQVHLHKEILNDDGTINLAKLNPLARIGGPTYASIKDFFNIL